MLRPRTFGNIFNAIELSGAPAASTRASGSLLSASCAAAALCSATSKKCRSLGTASAAAACSGNQPSKPCMSGWLHAYIDLIAAQPSDMIGTVTIPLTHTVTQSPGRPTVMQARGLLQCRPGACRSSPRSWSLITALQQATRDLHRPLPRCCTHLPGWMPFSTRSWRARLGSSRQRLWSISHRHRRSLWHRRCGGSCKRLVHTLDDVGRRLAIAERCGTM